MTATDTITTSIKSCVTGGGAHVPAGQLTGTNLTTFVEPDPPTGSVGVNACVSNANHPPDLGVTGQVTNTIAFNKPIIGPVLHVENLDLSTLTIGGNATSGSAITLAPIVSNPALEISGNTLNSTEEDPLNNGCEGNLGFNPNGGCSSIRLSTAGGDTPIQSFTMDNVASGMFGAASNDGDGWRWSMSFPTVTLTKTFSPSSIPATTVGQLTFTIRNPNNPGAIALRLMQNGV